MKTQTKKLELKKLQTKNALVLEAAFVSKLFSNVKAKFLFYQKKKNQAKFLTTTFLL